MSIINIYDGVTMNHIKESMQLLIKITSSFQYSKEDRLLARHAILTILIHTPSIHKNIVENIQTEHNKTFELMKTLISLKIQFIKGTVRLQKPRLSKYMTGHMASHYYTRSIDRMFELKRGYPDRETNEGYIQLNSCLLSILPICVQLLYHIPANEVNTREMVTRTISQANQYIIDRTYPGQFLRPWRSDYFPEDVQLRDPALNILNYIHPQ